MAVLRLGGEGGAEFEGQLAREVEGLDQAGGAELPRIDTALQRLCAGSRQAGEEFGAFGFGDGGAGFGVALGRQQIGVRRSGMRRW
jgi:hypothetical protein